MKRVLIFPPEFTELSARPEQILRDAGLAFDHYTGTDFSPDALAAALAPYDGVVIHTHPLTRRVLAACPHLKCISCFTSGMDFIDLDAARELGIAVRNTAGANAEAVADHVFAMMLALARSLPRADRLVKSGQWQRILCLPVHGATLGIVGFGAIGRLVARRAQGFSMKVLAYDPYWDEEAARALGVTRVDLPELLAQSDFVTLHVGLNDRTRGMISAPQLALMKPNAILINCARGAVVNEGDLYTALCAGTLAGAGLDAFEQEPCRTSPLFALDNVLLTPHIAWSSRESLENMAIFSAQNCVDMLCPAGE